jgi:hypothetical protein
LHAHTHAYRFKMSEHLDDFSLTDRCRDTFRSNVVTDIECDNTQREAPMFAASDTKIYEET